MAHTAAPPECLTCHGTDLIEQQRLGASAWAREVDKMTRWGAPVSPERKDALVAELSARYGPTSTAQRATPHESGAEVFSRACLVCHGAELVDQQHLSSAGWTREVAKMVGWGAPVAEADRQVLAAYLAGRRPAGRD
jgi:mono/diheme cytochrome c family protein